MQIAAAPFSVLLALHRCGELEGCQCRNGALGNFASSVPGSLDLLRLRATVYAVLDKFLSWETRTQRAIDAGWRAVPPAFSRLWIAFQGSLV